MVLAVQLTAGSKTAARALPRTPAVHVVKVPRPSHRLHVDHETRSGPCVQVSAAIARCSLSLFDSSTDGPHTHPSSLLHPAFEMCPGAPLLRTSLVLPVLLVMKAGRELHGSLVLFRLMCHVWHLG